MNRKVVKSESIAEQVKEIGGFSRIGSAFSSKAYFSMKEMQRIGEFLVKAISAGSPQVCEQPPTSYGRLSEQEGHQTEAALQTASLQEDATDEQATIGLSCKACGKTDALNACSGKFGYYVKCGYCGGNTSMRISCPSCGGNQTRASKRGNVYWLSCQCSLVEKLFEQR
ncbi:hypothetical protein [Oceanimonas sp. MB9]|uniref:hypothetical protein n=1 Tax=Oceanimonas sp. MB9 TaxID=2588453 RepID=UPI00197EF9E8|nr:hypothetical protein [Oceanimonas sp. MB9]